MPFPDRTSPAQHHVAGLAGSPAVHRAERWWLAASSGAVPADAQLARALDRHAADLAAADRAVADAMDPA